MSDKPLFVPLKSEYFYQFKDGSKTDELRRYGQRWNENTCRIERRAVLSKGYGNHERLSAIISSFAKVNGLDIKRTDYRDSVEKLYGTLNVEIAFISFKDIAELESKESE